MKKLIATIASLAVLLNAGMAVTSASAAEETGHKKSQTKVHTQSTHKHKAPAKHKAHAAHKASKIHAKSKSHAKKLHAKSIGAKSLKTKATNQMPKTGFGGASEQME
ncbi:hypothetical protein [Paenibacillus sp. SN-8-1]|uniref:hypothetical protein n=1 Tax=Paenibacillus sp. SN-8-1 TaxID=3435409 RepID=UPI003D9A8BA9